MKTLLLSLAVAGTVLLSSFTVFTTWRIADDYVVRFDGRGAEGTFQGLAGTVRFDPRDPTAGELDVTVDVRTINTGNTTKDRHARGEGWFDAARYPTIRFQSTRFGKDKDGHTVTGKLTLHGTTREITFPFTFTPVGSGGLFEGQFEVERKDYGIKGTFGQFAVSNTFEVKLRVPVE